MIFYYTLSSVQYSVIISKSPLEEDGNNAETHGHTLGGERVYLACLHHINAVCFIHHGSKTGLLNRICTQ